MPLRFREKSGVLVDRFNQLVTDALHAGDRRVSVLLFDVVKFDQLDVVVLADHSARFIDLFSEFRVEDRVDLCLRVALLKCVKKFSESRSETLAVFSAPSFILIFAYRGACPCVVRTSEEEDDVRVSEHVHS